MYLYNKHVAISELEGKVIREIAGLESGSEEVNIFTDCGKHYRFYHEQDCCESVDLDDFDGDPEDLKGGLIVSAEEIINSGDEESEGKPHDYSESFTWTFYKIETNKGGIWMRWLGESNGYYSESVYLVWVNKPEARL